MDRLTEIRQRTEAATDGPLERFDTPYYAEIHILGGKEAGFLPVALADEAYDGLKRAIDTANANAKLFDEATARAEAAEAERDAAVEDLKQHILWNGTACTYCRYCEEAESALSPCDTCEDIPDTKMPTNWEWRGPQEAGEGRQ